MFVLQVFLIISAWIVGED